MRGSKRAFLSAMAGLPLLLALCMATARAVENNAAEPAPSAIEESTDQAAVQIIRQSYRLAEQVARHDEQSQVHKSQIQKLHAAFNSFYVPQADADPLSLFWAEVDKGLLPAADSGDEKASARSFVKLTKLYDLCCRLPTREAGAVSVHSGHQFSDVELNALQADIQRNSKDGVANLSVSSVILAPAISGLAVAVALAVFIAYRARAGRRQPPHNDIIAKPLYLQDEQVKAHANLDAIMILFREKLFAFGAPSIRNGGLYFGSRLIDGDTDIVDEFATIFGCFATVFSKDKRVATNIILPDGTRALGTTLDPGPRYDMLMLGQSFAGEVELFEDKILALYEPVVFEGEVVAILFAGIRLHEDKSDQLQSMAS